MDTAEIRKLFTQEQRIDIEFPGMVKQAFPDLVRFTRPNPGMSEVAYTCLDKTSADGMIRAQVEYFRQLNATFTWKVYDYDTPDDLGERLLRHGFARPYETDTIMVLDLQEVPDSLLLPSDTFDIRPIRSAKKLSDVIKIEKQVYGGSFEWVRARLGSHLKIPGYLNVYAAYVDDAPVSAGWVYFTKGQFASIWGGATLAQYRKQGFYTALLAVRVQEAIRRGYRFLTIDAGAMSRPIVAAHGFRLLTTAQEWEWEPEKAEGAK